MPHNILHKRRFTKSQKKRIERVCVGIFFFVLFVFSFHIMFQTFGYDTQQNIMRIAPKAWSDFGAHIPLIRSFSKGANLKRLLHITPVESPLYPGEPIRYHYGFYALVGMLEYLGMRIDYAFNIPSAFGLFLLCVGVFIVAQQLFKRTAVSILSVLFLLFNGSLSFLYYFSKHPLSTNIIRDIIENKHFASFGPWDGQLVTAFWSLNIYTNQRHLALSFAITLFIVYILLTWPKKHTSIKILLRKSLFLSLLFSSLVFINHAAFAIACLFALWFFLTNRTLHIPLSFAALLTVPCYLFVSQTSTLPSSVTYRPFYLAPLPVTFVSFVTFWLYNLGLHSFLIPLGIVFSNKRVRKILIIPLIVLFIIPNIIQFSPDMINNHKFFNFFLILGNMLSAYVIVKIWNDTKSIQNILLKMSIYIMLTVTVFYAVLSGIIDFFPIYNETKGSHPDSGSTELVRFIEKHTQKDSVILNSRWLYHPAQTAGRAIFSGYPYFTWSYGYDKDTREKQAQEIYAASDIATLCSLLYVYDIDMVELTDPPEYVQPNMALWNNLTPSYRSEDTHVSLYLKDILCTQ